MQREEVLQKLEPIIGLKVRQADGRGARVTATAERIGIRPAQGAHFIEMNTNGAQGLAKFIGVSWDLVKNLQPGTFGDVATQILVKKADNFGMVMKDGIVVDFLKGGSHNVDIEKALTVMGKVIPDVDYHRAVVEGHNISLEVVGDKRQPVVRGDLIQAGALVRFSPLGSIAPSIQSYALRLACTNGATSNTILREYKYTGGDGGRDGGSTGPIDGDSFWQWFRKSTHDAYGALNEIVTQYQAMIKERISPADRAALLEGMLKQAHISGPNAEAVRAMALQNPPTNSYDMLNLLTYATSHILDNPTNIRQAQTVIADYSSEEEHARICPLCHSKRSQRKAPVIIDAQAN